MDITTVIFLIIIGLAAGILSGLAGIGGGIIMVPALVLFLGLSQKYAQGVSLTMMLLPAGILAVYNYYKAGYVNIKFALILFIAFIIGGYFGSKITINLISESVLKKTFGIFMIIVAVKMIFGK
jgi:uncharacterized membrane protein YfcA